MRAQGDFRPDELEEFKEAFGLFDNTQSWPYGTASSANQTIELTTPLGGASHIDFVVITWPANTPATGPGGAAAAAAPPERE